MAPAASFHHMAPPPHLRPAPFNPPQPQSPARLPTTPQPQLPAPAPQFHHMAPSPHLQAAPFNPPKIFDHHQYDKPERIYVNDKKRAKKAFQGVELNINGMYVCWLDPKNRYRIQMRQIREPEIKDQYVENNAYTWKNAHFISVDLHSSFQPLQEMSPQGINDYLSDGAVNSLPTPIPLDPETSTQEAAKQTEVVIIGRVYRFRDHGREAHCDFFNANIRSCDRKIVKTKIVNKLLRPGKSKKGKR